MTKEKKIHISTKSTPKSQKKTQKHKSYSSNTKTGEVT